MKRFVYSLLTIIFCLVAVAPNAHADSPAVSSGPVLLTELQTGSVHSASEEFIELYNASDAVVDFGANHWQVQIGDAAAADWKKPHRSIALTGALAPGEYYILASQVTTKGQVARYVPDTANAWFSAGMAATAGHIRLAYKTNQKGADGICAPATTVSDELEWGARSADARTTFATLPSGIRGGQSLQRLAAQAGYRDTDNDATDFALGEPSPKAINTAPDPARGATYPAAPLLADGCTVAPNDPADPPVDDDGERPAPVLPPGDAGLMAPQMSELLPNPAAPATDAADEFIELYNPNDAPFDLSGFTLQTGLATKHAYLFPDNTLLPAKGFVAFYSRDTELTLSNSGGQVTLLDPFGSVIAQSDPYDKAAAGQVWVLTGNGWQWSQAATPNAANYVETPPSPPAPAHPSTAKKAAPKAAAVKAAKVTAAKPKAAKKSAAVNPPAPTTVAAEPAKGGVGTGVLALIALIAVVYGGYEYRHDLANKLHQLRANRSAGRKDRPGA